MEKQDLVELITKIQSCDYDSELDSDLAIEFLIKNVADPEAIDYIFQKQYEELTPNEIAEKIISYKSINLGFKTYQK